MKVITASLSEMLGEFSNDSINAHWLLGRLLLNKGDVKNAENCFKKIFKHPNPSTKLQILKTFYFMQKTTANSDLLYQSIREF